MVSWYCLGFHIFLIAFTGFFSANIKEIVMLKTLGNIYKKKLMKSICRKMINDEVCFKMILNEKRSGI